MTRKHLLTAAAMIFAATILAVLLGPGQASASHRRLESVKIFAGANATGDILWEIEEVPFFRGDAWWVFIGTSSQSYLPAYTFTRDRFYQGSWIYGPILFTFDNDTVYQGPNRYGQALFTLFGDRLIEGKSVAGDFLFTFSNRRVFAGGNTRGEILVNTYPDINDFSGPLRLVLGVLLTQPLGPPGPVPPPGGTPAPPPPPPRY